MSVQGGGRSEFQGGGSVSLLAFEAGLHPYKPYSPIYKNISTQTKSLITPPTVYSNMKKYATSDEASPKEIDNFPEGITPLDGMEG